MSTTEALIAVKVQELPEGYFLATSEQLPGLVAQGRTVAETLEIAQDVARKIIESFRDHGDELPEGLSTIDTEAVEVRIPVALG